ncbi:hypothetical protein Ndes2526B_g04122 [Nannochloris sp. 'desiccata']|nr:hypothetical protein KSW81_001097 [Chlorella desiccata (nom. nud.)]KAH7620208.1 putative Cytochrome c oxidase subunit 6b-1 [Chlorella desiccata (nom. nud.)]
MSAEEVAVAETVVEEVAIEPEVEEVEETRTIVIDTAPIDPRFPATNQARNCFVKYNEAHKCYAEKGEGAPECARIARDYRSICPTEWVAAWNEARENGTWFGKY